GLKAQKDPDALAIAKKQLELEGKTLTDDAIKQQAYNNAMAQYGTGSDFQKVAQAVTGLLQGLAGDNLAGALANASSPYLATLIKQQIGEDNKAANAMAHAVLGAVVAELNNQSATAGGLGAGGGELSAHVILNTLFPGKRVSDLTESEKQQVSALSQLAAGLAGGLTTGDMAGAITGSQAGKNAVENNALVVPTPAGPIVLPVVIPGTSDTTNEQLALSIERALKNMGKTISDTLSPEDKTQALNDAMKALTPEQQAQLNAQIVAERESNQIALGKPLVKDMNDYLATNETGKFIKEQSKLLGYDNSGNPIYQAVNGAGNFINADDKMKLSGSKDALLVYSKEGVFVSALNLDGSRNDTLTAIYKGGYLSAISDIKTPNHTGGNQIPEQGKTDTSGNQIPDQGRIDTGGNQIVDSGRTDTSGNQIPEPIEKLPGTPIPDSPSLDDLAYLDKITQGEHAGIRNKEGRPVGSVINDVQKSRPSDILVQDDGRWVVKGNDGRIHLIEPDGEVVTSFKNSDKNTAQRIRDGRWNRPSNEELDEFKDRFSDYVRW
uniref:VENN motif pre-toxin domain-containing protein n=1 Tax=Proteus mirabilis TaxID=584 RepID=UPI0034D72269